MHGASWVGLAIVIVVAIGTATFWIYFWFSYLPNAAVQDYEPDDGSEVAVAGEILMSENFRSGGMKTQRALYYYTIGQNPEIQPPK